MPMSAGAYSFDQRIGHGPVIRIILAWESERVQGIPKPAVDKLQEIELCWGQDTCSPSSMTEHAHHCWNGVGVLCRDISAVSRKIWIPEQLVSSSYDMLRECQGLIP